VVHIDLTGSGELDHEFFTGDLAQHEPSLLNDGIGGIENQIEYFLGLRSSASATRA
jgi:hypothetical protein